MPKTDNFWQNLSQPFLALAPMEGVTDVVFRQVITKAGRPEVFFTEFTNVSSFASEKGRFDALERLDIAGLTSAVGCKNTKNLETFKSENGKSAKNLESPIVAQIWGKNPKHFAETASALSDMGFSGLDINMGCPDRHVNKAGGGAYMINTPELAVECITRAKEATNLPVSVKTRLGYSYMDEYRTWLPLLLQQDLAALTVHLRTRKEMSKVPAHYELISKIIKMRNEIAPNTVLIINGDILDKKEYKKLVKKHTPKEDKFNNILISFFIGGLCGVFGELLTDIFNKLLHFSISDSYMLTMVSFVLIGSVLTGLGFFDKWVNNCKCGLIVPITGFAHSMMSATMEYKKEGLITGIGSNMFKLSGTVIAYGVISATLFGFIRLLIGG